MQAFSEIILRFFYLASQFRAFCGTAPAAAAWHAKKNFTIAAKDASMFYNVNTSKYRQVSRAGWRRGEKGSGVKIPRGAAAVLAWPLYDVTVRMYGKAKRPISLSQKTCLSGHSPFGGKLYGQRTL